MTKYIAVAVLGSLFVATTALAATNYGANIRHAVLVGAVEIAPGDEAGVYKFTDGNTSCYVVSSRGTAISCVR